VLVEAIAVGVCGTDVEIVEGKYGWSPRGADRLVLGHESLGRVLDPGPASALKGGDLVVGIVRRPDPVPCPNCAVGEWDMCRNGQYTERGIKEIHGLMSERWRIEPEYAGLEPSSRMPFGSARAVRCPASCRTQAYGVRSPGSCSAPSGRRSLFAFAAHNCGPGNMAKLRKEAGKRGRRATARTGCWRPARS